MAIALDTLAYARRLREAGFRMNDAFDKDEKRIDDALEAFERRRARKFIIIDVAAVLIFGILPKLW